MIPNFRATFDEGLGNVDDGITIYICDYCGYYIHKNRYHKICVNVLDICEGCYNKYEKNSNVKFLKTVGLEQEAEMEEINYASRKIISDYKNKSDIIPRDFKDFLLNNNAYSIIVRDTTCVFDWLRQFNGFTLNYFIHSNFYCRSLNS